ncbi:hypothetical protein FACS1894109_03290 [Spirochaetia bacterium]|nr:hypothetical protein FACS1894109_03290 [Spirochaetia bacterium]
MAPGERFIAIIMASPEKDRQTGINSNVNKYNGERGKWKGMKWFFYIYYPLHLAILAILGIK